MNYHTKEFLLKAALMVAAALGIMALLFGVAGFVLWSWQPAEWLIVERAMVAALWFVASGGACLVIENRRL